MVRPRTLCSALVLALALTFASAARAADVTVLVRPGAPPNGPAIFPTIQNAIDHAPLPTGGGRVIIRITPGVYHERLWIPQNRPNLTLLGLGARPDDTVITSGHFANEAGGTFFTETVEVNGDGFEADNVTFANTAGDAGQALAISVLADRALFKHCRFLGYQDTLFANYGRQYYTGSYIEGAVDFIFGNAAAVFDHDQIHATAPGYITAQSRLRPSSPTGFVILDSTVTTAFNPGDPANLHGRLYAALGRPWRPYSRVIYLNCHMGPGILPEGWSKWNKDDDSYRTTFYAEAGSTGAGADPSDRVSWARKLTPAEIESFQPRNFLRGSDGWNPVAEAARLP